MKKLPRRALTLWQIRLTAAVLPAPVLIALFFPVARYAVWHAALTSLWIAGYLFMFLFFFPCRRYKLSYGVSDHGYVVHCGVFYNRIKAMELVNIQNVAYSASPLERAMKLCTLSVFSAGSVIVVPAMEEKEAQALCERLTRGGKGGRR